MALSPQTTNYSDATIDTTNPGADLSGPGSNGVFPLLGFDTNGTATFTGRLTAGSDTSDFFAIDVAGGSHDWSGSLPATSGFTVSLSYSGTGYIALQGRREDYTYLNLYGPYGSTTLLSSATTIAVSYADWFTNWGSGLRGSSPYDYVLGFQVVSQNFTGTYTVTIQKSGGGGPTPLPDFTATNNGLSVNALTPGSNVTVGALVSNAGNAAGAPGRIAYYISTDPTITSSDTLLGYYDLTTTIAAGSGVVVNVQLTVPASLAPGTYYIGFIVNDNGAASESNRANDTSTGRAITVIGPNHLPAAVNDLANTDPGKAVVIRVLDNDSDPDRDGIFISAILKAPRYGNVVVNADNTITYIPGADYTFVDSFTYQIADGRGGTSSATVTITPPVGSTAKFTLNPFDFGYPVSLGTGGANGQYVRFRVLQGETLFSWVTGSNASNAELRAVTDNNDAPSLANYPALGAAIHAGSSDLGDLIENPRRYEDPLMPGDYLMYLPPGTDWQVQKVEADEAGNNLHWAKDIGTALGNATPLLTNGYVNRVDDQDWFTFKAQTPSAVSIFFKPDQSTISTWGAHLKPPELGYSHYLNAGQEGNFEVLTTSTSPAIMGAGTYYFSVQSPSWEYTYERTAVNPPVDFRVNYNVVINAWTDIGGNTQANATSFGDLSRSVKVVQDTIGYVDPNDYYVFTVTERSTIGINAYNPTATANHIQTSMQLIKVSGAIDQQWTKTYNDDGNGPDFNGLSIVAGTYVVRVYTTETVQLASAFNANDPNNPWPKGGMNPYQLTVNVTTNNTAPNVVGTNVTLGKGVYSTPASSFFSAIDPEGDPITAYAFYDVGYGGGRLLLNGVVQAIGTRIDITAAQLSQLSWQAGATADIVYVQASDNPLSWSGWSTAITLTPFANHAPTASGASRTLARGGTTVAASTLVTASDADGDTITMYGFANAGTGGGRFYLGGVAQATGAEIDVTAAQLSSLTYSVGSATDTLYVKAKDGTTWSDWSAPFTITPPFNRAPTATGLSRELSRGALTVTASSFVQVYDADGDPIQSYTFYNVGIGGGHFNLNGVAQSAAKNITVSFGQLSTLTYTVGTAPDTLYAQVSDGIATSEWSPAFTVSPPVNHAPVVTAANRNLTRGQTSVIAASLVSATDPDGDAVTSYNFYDVGTGGGKLVLNGVTQATNVVLSYSAAQFAQLSYAAGTATDTLYVQASDGGLTSDWKSFLVSPAVNRAPVVTAPNRALAHGQSSVAVTSLVSASDPDGDPVTSYQLYDTGAGGGHLSLGGTNQSVGTVLTYTAAQLTQLSYLSGTATDTVYVKASDGSATSEWTAFTVTPGPNNAPSASGNSRSLPRGTTSVAASTLVTTNDLDGDAIATYDFLNIGAGGGRFYLGGVAQAIGAEIVVTVAQLATLTYTAGTSSDTLYVRANDGAGWGAWSSPFTVSPWVNRAPVVTASNGTLTRSQSSVAVTNFVSASDPDGDAVTSYQLYDVGAGGGHLTLSGVTQATGTILTYSAAQLAQLTYVAGSATDQLYVAASDGSASSAFTAFTVSPWVNRAPAITTANLTLTRGVTTVAASSLFATSDPDGDAIASYSFYDSGAGGGHLALGGVTQAAGTILTYSAAQLAQLTYVAGSATDQLYVAASDGSASSAFSAFTVSPWVNRPPAAGVANQTVRAVPTAASTLFTASDPDGDAIVTYAFYNAGAGGGHFLLNGVSQGVSQEIDVTAAQLPQLSYLAGTAPDTLYVKLFDGTAWGGWSNPFIVTPVANKPPVVSASDATQARNSDISLSTFFSVSDEEGDAIQTFQIMDKTLAGAGTLYVSGVAQPAATAITVTPAQIIAGSVTFRSGANVGSDTLSIRAFDGYDWGAWKDFQVQTVNTAPVVTGTNKTVVGTTVLAASALFAVSDADGDAITAFQFRDDTTGGGYFSLGGVPAAAATLDATAAQLAQVTFTAGPTGTDHLAVRAFDGTVWSDWTSLLVAAQSPPVVTAKSTTLFTMTVAASSLFSVSDADGDAITQYALKDVTGNGAFIVNGVTQTANAEIDLTPAQLAQTIYQAGSSADNIQVRASDASGWGAWVNLNVLYKPAPTYTFSSFGVSINSAISTYATGINNLGEIVGYETGASGLNQHGFVSVGGIVITLDAHFVLPGGGSSTTTVTGVNAGGSIVGYYQYTSLGTTKIAGFLDSGDTFNSVSYPSGTWTQLNGINAAGQIVGSYYDSASKMHSFTYSGGVGGTFTALPDIAGARDTVAEGINNAGQITGYYSDANGSQHGFVYSNGAYATLDDPAGSGTTPTGINASGVIVGNFRDTSGNYQGFVYDSGRFSTLSVPYATNGGTIASGINDAGQIAGYYYDVHSIPTGFVATPS